MCCCASPSNPTELLEARLREGAGSPAATPALLPTPPQPAWEVFAHPPDRMALASGYGFGLASSPMNKKRRWYLGVQSKKEPGSVMAEVFRALRDGGFVRSLPSLNALPLPGSQSLCFCVPLCLHVRVCVRFLHVLCMFPLAGVASGSALPCAEPRVP